jgi:hypothetical protein
VDLVEQQRRALRRPAAEVVIGETDRQAGERQEEDDPAVIEPEVGDLIEPLEEQPRRATGEHTRHDAEQDPPPEVERGVDLFDRAGSPSVDAPRRSGGRVVRARAADIRGPSPQPPKTLPGPPVDCDAWPTMT